MGTFVGAVSDLEWPVIVLIPDVIHVRTNEEKHVFGLCLKLITLTNGPLLVVTKSSRIACVSAESRVHEYSLQ